MKRMARCAWCGEQLHRGEEFVEYGWWGQFGDAQAFTHRGRCSRRFDRVVARDVGPGAWMGAALGR